MTTAIKIPVSPSKTGSRTFRDLASETPFAEEFVSANQASTISTTTNVAHGMSSAPKFVQIIMECITAQFNYSVGDTIIHELECSALVTSGLTVLVDATNVTLIRGTGTMHVMNKTTSANVAYTAANWEFIIHAYA